jgi:hypothetical protein
MAGARRFVWNWALRRWKDHYAATGKSISPKQLSAELTALKAKPETAWLNDVDSQALQQTLKDQHRAFINCFEKRAGYPRFKSRKRDKARFRIPQRIKLEDGKVYVPKVGWIRIRQSQETDGMVKGATFRREADGHWYVNTLPRLKSCSFWTNQPIGQLGVQGVVPPLAWRLLPMVGFSLHRSMFYEGAFFPQPATPSFQRAASEDSHHGLVGSLVA